MFEDRLIGWMKRFDRLIHILLAAALVIACLMVVWDFASKAISTFQAGNAARGFFHAFGSLFILWTLSTLISAEINYLQTSRVYVRVFVEVAMITIIREIIVSPVEAMSTTGGAGETFNPVYYGLLLAALLVSGVVYKLVGHSSRPSGSSGDVSA